MSVADMQFTHDPYLDFLRAKAVTAPQVGIHVELSEINPLLKPHHKLMVRWALAGGRRAIFASFGLGKTVVQLEIMRLILKHIRQEHGRGRGLITAPLGVRQEFKRDAEMLATGDHPEISDAQREELRAWQEGHPERIPEITFIRSIEEAGEDGIYLTNYETVRDGRLDPRLFDAATLDEASCLRGFGGTKTFREFMRLFAGDGKSLHKRERGAEVRYRFVATATPSPNDYIELLSYAAFLGIMEVSQAKTRFFRRNSEKADKLTLHPHKEEEFWLWVASWALFIQKPSDLGFSDEGYELPEMEVVWHEVPVDHSALAGEERDGQARMFANASIGVVDAARTKRETLSQRVEKLMEIRALHPDRRRLIWHDLEAERHAIEAAVPDVVSVYGSQDLDEREQAIVDFSDGRIRELAAKPVIAGSGCNFQRHCSEAVFLGIGFKFNDFIQAIHRIYRFLQTRRVTIHIIYSEAERGVRRVLEGKWKRHNEMVQRMTEIIKKFGLSHAAMAEALTRSIGVERVEVTGPGFRLINNDCVEEMRTMPENSVGLIVTSIPFSTQYEYTPSYNDFGHTDTEEHFWRQMDYLTPEQLRVLQPGRVAAIHVKDRIVPGGLTGLGFQTVAPFSDHCVAHFQKHGFAFLGRKTVVTDVVRENNQTYRLGWSEQCKDGSKMGAGLPEYVLLFRKPPTDASNGYADLPVVKLKKTATREGWENPEGYSRGRWQLDAHGFTRSSGNRLLAPEDLVGQPADVIYKMWREFSLSAVYDFEHHVRVAETLELNGSLPPTFMLLPPQSWHEDVWTDVTRMLTLNGQQHAAGKEMHLCPLQFDIVDRLIVQFSMEGETVLDPFGGLMTVPYRALPLGREAIAIELNPGYFVDGTKYVQAAAEKVSMPSLFDLLDAGDTEAKNMHFTHEGVA